MMQTWRSRGGIVVLALALQGCASPPAAPAPADESAGAPQWKDYRFREEAKESGALLFNGQQVTPQELGKRLKRRRAR
jgi:hypothetical protein